MTTNAQLLQSAAVTIDQTLQQAIAHHKAGQLQDAERIYRAILQAEPNHPDANHNLGVLAAQLGQYAAALPYLKTALTINSAQGQYSLSYAEALLATGQAIEALSVMEAAMKRGLDTAAARALRAKAETATRSEFSLIESPKAGKAATKKRTPKKTKSLPSRSTALSLSLLQTEINHLVALFNAGHHAETESRARLLVYRYPDSGLAWKALGLFLQAQAKDAVPALQTATELLPDDAEIHNSLGNALRYFGQPDKAAASYRRALKIKPDYAEAHSNLGAALRDVGQLDKAVASYRRALEIKPDYAEAHNNLGNALQDLGQLDGAFASYRRALEIKPDYAEAHYNLGNALQALGQLDDAVASYRRALEIKSDLAEAYSNMGTALKDLGQLDGAVASYRRALEIKPDSAEVHNNMGVALENLGQLDEGTASYRRALEIKPDYADAHNNLGVVLQNLGRLDEALTSYRRALEIKPDIVSVHSNLLFCLSHNATVDAASLFSEHCRFGEQFEEPLRANWPQHANSRDPDRPLHVGFVSGDFRDHAVAHFIEPVLAHLSSYAHLSLHGYSNHALEDAVTQRLRAYLPHWRQLVGLSDVALAQTIRADGIDILVDLSGHTARNRLLTFARKPAPVQASWMGYPGTTGLRAMDYYLADKFFLPQEQFASQFTEDIVHLPVVLPFMPSDEAPPVNTLPALGMGHVTFGSFNRTDKLSRSVIALWAQLLRARADSRMLLGGMPEEGKYDTLIDWFAQEGIAQDRLSFHVRSGMASYLSLHHQVDICLDTFPYNGGTTTCHALWMGVPTLTIAGGTAAARPGAAILGHAGLEGFVAHDAEDFVQKGLSWAGNLGALAAIRAGLRERFTNSAMGQPAVVAAGLERALRTMWQRWCAGLPAQSFEVSLHDIRNAMQEADK
ncbi:MAG: tetratricopeptide repeat protein [Sulfuritalea sp.]|nr:tetratricopeptide repeat protein [Sulfuritalea sp.]